MKETALPFFVLIVPILAALACGQASIPTPQPLPTETPPPTGPAVAMEPPVAIPGETWIRPGDDMIMVHVKTGAFQMGSNEGDDNERPVHIVGLDAWWIDRTEVTNVQYRRCVKAGECDSPRENGSQTRDSYYDDSTYDDYPVIYVSWDQATDYCSWVGARLPTEAEWEYAARGPQGQVFPWGDEFDGNLLNSCDANCELGWADVSIDDGYEDTAPVGSYEGGASWCGALDMAGNVWEWVDDWYAADYYEGSPARNPTGPSTGEHRMLRGGSWYNYVDFVRSAYRTWHDPVVADTSIGFRCAKDAGSAD